MLSNHELELAADGYLAAAGWLPGWDERASDEDNERGCDTDAQGGPFGDDARQAARDAVRDLVGALDNGSDALAYIDVMRKRGNGGAGMLGHDLWLTRNGHGAGFWDRGLDDLGERLSAAARSLGEAYSYIDAEGVVRIDG